MSAPPAASVAAPVASTAKGRKRKPRKRRKKNNKAGGISSDSDSSSDDSSDDEPVKVPVKAQPVKKVASVSSSSSSSSSSDSSSSSSSSDSDSDSDRDAGPSKPIVTAPIVPTEQPKTRRRFPSRSLSPPSREIPAFVPPPSTSKPISHKTPAKGKARADEMEVDSEDVENDDDAVSISSDDEAEETDKLKRIEEDEAAEQKASEERQARFRKLWLSKVVTAFGNDLDQLRKDEPGLTGSKLELLIDSLAAGTEVFNDGKSKTARGMDVDEVGVVLGD